jgi:peroxiredoxin Q/BCP
VGYTFGVGLEAPAFTLSAQDGSRVSLKDFRGDWLPIVVFYEAAGPQAVAQLAALSAAADQFWGLRGQLLAVSAAPADEQRRLAEKVEGLAFPLLTDSDGRVAHEFGAVNRKTGRPVEATYVVDRSGKIVWVGEGDEALKPSSLLAALQSVAR